MWVLLLAIIALLCCGGRAVVDAQSEGTTLCERACALGEACRDIASTGCEQACAVKSECPAERDAYWQCMVDNVPTATCAMPEPCVALLDAYLRCEPFIDLFEATCADLDTACECAADYLYADLLVTIESRCSAAEDGVFECECQRGDTFLGSCRAEPVPGMSVANTCHPLRGCCSTLLHLPARQ